MEDNKEFEILRIKQIQDDYKDYKRTIALLATLGIIGSLTSVISFKDIINYQIPITTKNNLNRLLYAFAIAGIPIGSIGIGGAINEYSHM